MALSSDRVGPGATGARAAAPAVPRGRGATGEHGGAPTRTSPVRWQRRSGTAPWYLVYLVIPVFPLVFDPATTPMRWALSAVLVVGFAIFYLAVGRAQGGSAVHRTSPVVAAVLGLAAVPVNPGATVLVVYSAAFAGEAWSRRAATRWFGALTLVCAAPLLLPDVPLGYRLWSVLPAALFVWVIGMEVVGSAERERATAALRVENARVEALATLTERERLARDVHDALGQSLTSVLVRSQLARRLVGSDPQHAADELVELERVARDALADVRTTLSGWRHVRLDDELAVATATLAAAGVVAEVEREDLPALPPAVETALALALREAATNVVRHAGAQRVVITLGRGGGDAVLLVQDDGGGAGAVPGGGLTGMRERLAAVGGTVVVGAAPAGGASAGARAGGAGRGTRLRAAVPVPACLPSPAPASVPASVPTP